MPWFDKFIFSANINGSSVRWNLDHRTKCYQNASWWHRLNINIPRFSTNLICNALNFWMIFACHHGAFWPEFVWWYWFSTFVNLIMSQWCILTFFVRWYEFQSMCSILPWFNLISFPVEIKDSCEKWDLDHRTKCCQNASWRHKLNINVPRLNLSKRHYLLMNF